ncbi:MAG: hypothetical protein AAF565_17265 [Pseudomonadota bacterium]
MRATARVRIVMASLGIMALVAGGGRLAAAEAACAPPQGSIFHVCEGYGTARLMLLPEDWPPTQGPNPGELIVSGGYTGRDAREGGLAAPVGLLIRDGQVIGRNIARMDGILLIGADGVPALHPRGAVKLGAERYDLGPLNERQAFFDAARAGGISALQSHLLVIDGRVDTREVEGAPVARRRILYTRGGGFGVWQSDQALTLDAAARRLAAEVAPDMALNLDMGSFDFCLAGLEGSSAQSCGAIAPQQLPGRLSNLLRLSPGAR